jgi:hypothetical protein
VANLGCSTAIFACQAFFSKNKKFFRGRDNARPVRKLRSCAGLCSTCLRARGTPHLRRRDNVLTSTGN